MNTKYTVEHRGNCVLITGAVPMASFGVLTQLAPHGSVMDPNCARMWGANFAFGPEEELAALRKDGAATAEQRVRMEHPGASGEAVKWLAGGERGISSNYIFTYLTGINAMQGWDTTRDCHPHDPADFRRCQLLLEQVPELQRVFHRMARPSNEWDRLVKAWPDIIAAMDEETPGWRDGKTRQKATKAYNLIKAAIGR